MNSHLVKGGSMYEIPTRTFTQDMGYYATSRGTDLFTNTGFLTITLEKIKPLTLFFTGSFLTISAGVIYWLATHLSTWFCYIDSVLKWCNG